MPHTSRLVAPAHRLALRALAVVGALVSALMATVLLATPALADYTGPYVPPTGTGPANGGTLPGGVGPADGQNGNGLLPNTGSEISLWLIALALALVVLGFALLRRSRRAAL
ncbi:hypothetical protein GCM10022215_07240 [Nocardioides fonticola]|uniref:Gram-positive cocci surface proteins LPxTG domain-containing protein n=1 Tax=Nocardioides fonticola TaxID=450363 RepID=A0ABP7XCD7_9ACTN